MKHTAALITALLVTGPAVSAEPTFRPGFAWDIVRYAGPVAEVSESPVNLIRIGAIDVALEHTPTSAIAEAFGGDVHHQGEAGEAAAWICYVRDDRSFWFYSDGEMGEGKVAMVAVDDAPGAAANAGCSEAPRAFDSIDFGIRAFGDWMSVMGTFGKVEPDEHGTFGYTHIAETVVDGRPYVTAQELVYRRAGDHIAAIALIQSSGD